MAVVNNDIPTHDINLVSNLAKVMRIFVKNHLKFIIKRQIV